MELRAAALGVEQAGRQAIKQTRTVAVQFLSSGGLTRLPQVSPGPTNAAAVIDGCEA
jgi:hypothetical protein